MHRHLLRRLASLLLALLMGGTGCGPSRPPAAAPPLPEAVTHETFHELLGRYVSEDGHVAYQQWAHHPPDVEALDRYIAELAETSPQSLPTLFPSSSDRLSYWINLYNALVMREVLRRWPLATVDDVRIDNPRFEVAGRGLLHDLSFDVGGRRMTLLEMERAITRDRFGDARTHFAISCSARSCPLLPPHPFDPRRLDEQLDEAARRFVNDSANVAIDPERGNIQLSPLFRWYERDFVRFVKDRTSHPAPTVVDFLTLYAEPPLSEEIQRAQSRGFELAYRAYDWSVGKTVAGGPPDTGAPDTDAPDTGAPATENALAVGAAMPGYAFERLDGRRWTIGEASGKVVLIDFWSTFCRPCLASFPQLEALQEELGRDRFLVVTVAEDDDVAPVEAFREATSTELLIVHDPRHLASEPPLAIERLPTELLIDERGVIRYRFEGLDDPPVGRIAERARELLRARGEPEQPNRSAQAP